LNGVAAMMRLFTILLVVLVVDRTGYGQSAPLSPPTGLLDASFTTIDGGSRPFETLVQAQASTPAGGPPPATTGNSADYDNGNDPTKVRKRLTFKSDYTRFANGLGVSTTTLQASFPILQEAKLKANFGFDVPLNYYEVKNPIDAILTGVGDMKAQVVFVRPATERVTFVFGTNLWLPTAEQQLLRLPNPSDFTAVDLGTGLFRIEPLVGAVFFISPELFIIPFYAHDLSFAGKREAKSINRGTARLFVNYNLPAGYYVSSETQFLINYANENDLDAFQRLELGKSFKNGTVFYVKPGVGLAPGPFNREWGVEAGLRFVF
ncbi:MAG: hypothetical protein ACRCZF_00150, partial [Gemmataceae bacterium]